ncbi:MAG: protein TolQ [Methylococcales bacterium]|nr:protein TolQ [Methylococcales bacterium]
MNKDLSLIALIQDASLVVQLVMLLLVLASVLSWTYILLKHQQMRRSETIADEFEQEFWTDQPQTMHTKLTEPGFIAEGIEKIFMAGFTEYTSLHSAGGPGPQIQVENAQRAMRIELNRELERLDEHLPFLATVGSISPYIGLFGTVWGIMNSFRALGNVQQATLAQVAPGIAEALIATAIGLFAAIPAVIAYNRFASKLERLTSRYELFIEEFIVLLQRQAHKP